MPFFFKSIFQPFNLPALSWYWLLRKRRANRREWLFSSIVLRTLNATYAKCCEKNTFFTLYTLFCLPGISRGTCAWTCWCRCAGSDRWGPPGGRLGTCTLTMWFQPDRWKVGYLVLTMCGGKPKTLDKKRETRDKKVEKEQVLRDAGGTERKLEEQSNLWRSIRA